MELWCSSHLSLVDSSCFWWDSQEDLYHDMIGVMKIKSWPY
jgi:hypothetical protein